MKIKEITDPTLRWAVIKRLLDRVPDRPAGAGNFVSGGQFSEPSRRTMPGRHAAERAAKQVWNEVVDELGSRPFFDDTLVRVHWIGLYTKRGQDLASNAISYIQEHAGVEHADEISATAYLREDLAKVTFSRPMIGVILRGRTTYAGAVDLGTQWSVKLKPEDIERQKGSGTRKLPWYEDEGTIADNMTVDETSWRDHVWGPQYYRTKMPELIVGSWSFDTVLIPQGVMSGAHDDMQRVIEVASSLGCKIIDERGNRYEPSEKTQITEAQLRRIIRETAGGIPWREQVFGDARGTWNVGDLHDYAELRYDLQLIPVSILEENNLDHDEQDPNHPDYKEFVARAMRSDPSKEIIVINYPDGLWIADGNHRTWKAREIGQPSMQGWILDWEEIVDIPHDPPSDESATSPY